MISQTIIDNAKQVDLIALIGADTTLHKIANTNGGEFAGPCPFCGGRDRLHVQPHKGRWFCRQCSESHWMDAIAYVRKRDNKSFEAACRELSGDIVPQLKRQVTTKKNANDENKLVTCPPSTQWQSRAKEIIVECESMLWSDCSTKARAWLFDQRGLNESTLHAWHIGYNATDRWDDPRLWGFDSGKRIYFPRGITIPCEVKGTLWGMKIRRPSGDPKYLQPRGSVSALFGAGTLGKHDYAILTEGEFDALLVWQALQQASDPAWHQAGVATLGSATHQLDVDVWADYVLPVSRFLVCYDADKEGIRGSEKWNTLTSRAHRVIVPTLKPSDKDLTDFNRSGGNILDLITFEITRDKWEREEGVSLKVAQVAQAAHPADDLRSMDLPSLRARRDALTIEWNVLMDQLQAMNQDTSEFDALFAVWEKVNDEYKRVCDRIDWLELTEEMGEM